MGYGDYCLCFPRYCFSTEDYKEWVNKHYAKSDDDDEKSFPKWFYLNLP